MSDREQPDTPAKYLLTGEDTPTWLPIGFTLIGTLLAAASAWLWMNEQPRLQEQPSQVDLIQEQTIVSATHPAVNLPTKPIAVPVETQEVAAVEKEDQSIRPEPFPPPSVPANGLAGPSDLQDSFADEQTIQASTRLPPRLKDCPPAITIPFKRGGVQPVITDDIQVHLEELLEWLNSHPEKKLAVEGHADSMGSERYNLLLSYRRAKAVVAILNKSGLPEQQMTILAAGENDPLEGIPDDSVDNRRVLLQIKGIENCQEVPTDSERS